MKVDEDTMGKMPPPPSFVVSDPSHPLLLANVPDPPNVPPPPNPLLDKHPLYAKSAPNIPSIKSTKSTPPVDAHPLPEQKIHTMLEPPKILNKKHERTEIKGDNVRRRDESKKNDASSKIHRDISPKEIDDQKYYTSKKSDDDQKYYTSKKPDDAQKYDPSKRNDPSKKTETSKKPDYKGDGSSKKTETSKKPDSKGDYPLKKSQTSKKPDYKGDGSSKKTETSKKPDSKDDSSKKRDITSKKHDESSKQKNSEKPKDLVASVILSSKQKVTPRKERIREDSTNYGPHKHADKGSLVKASERGPNNRQNATEKTYDHLRIDNSINPSPKRVAGEITMDLNNE